MMSLFLTLVLLGSWDLPNLDERLGEEILKGTTIKDSVCYEPDLGLVFKFRFYRGQPVDTTSVLPEPTYLEERWNYTVKVEFLSIFTDSLKTKSSRESGGGLIPDIEIPLEMPGGLGFLGKGGKLQIEGQQDISLGGRTSYYTDELSSEYGAPSKFPQLLMDQRLRVKLTGTVGQKIQVEVDHDSERENQLKNTVKLRYTGDEDEVIKKIEAGDITLSFPSTQYTGFPGGSRHGLFGFSTELQFGGLKLVAVASREQGETQNRTITPGTSMDTIKIYDADYIKGKFFWLGETDSITNIEVFLDDGNHSNDSIMNAKPGIAYFYEIDAAEPDTTYLDSGRFNWLQRGIDYTLHPGNVLEILKNPLSDPQILGVYYTTYSGKTVGDVSDTTNLKLKLIRPGHLPIYINPNPQNHQEYVEKSLWLLELKNVYSLGGTDLVYSKLQIQIKKEASGIDSTGENGKTYLEILGLDVNGDGRVEQTRTINGQLVTILDLVNGYLFFPSPLPFQDTALAEPDSAIYWYRTLQPDQGRKYYMDVVLGQRSDIISLGVVNIIEGSEVVKYNGRVLKKGVDYTIDYEAGILTILNDEVLSDPNADLSISFDYAPFISQKQKSLVATRFEYEWSDVFKIGSSWLMRSEGTIEERPRLGEEPTRNVLGELDMNLDLKLTALTTFLNKLPLISTEEPGYLRVHGEIAKSFPNPNIKNDAYLDDMEGVKLASALPISRTSWVRGSIPLDTTGAPLDTAGLGKIIWAIPPDMVKAGDIYPNLSEEEKDKNTTVLFIVVDTAGSGERKWVSLETILSKVGTDMTNMDYLEIFIKGSGAKLNIDLGYNIPEARVWRDRAGRVRGVDPSDHITNEDRNGNGTLEYSEDTGLDGVMGDDDKWTPPDSGVVQYDDGNDDYHYDPKKKWDYSKINGTEKNGGEPDNMDLDNNGFVDQSNDYFEFTIDLDDTSFIRPDTVTDAGWKYYRIPIKDSRYYRTFGNPSWDQIRYARLWISDFSGPDTIMIAKMEITGNRWRNFGLFTVDSLNPPDTLTERFRVGLANNKEHSYYSPPPQVKLKRDTRGVWEREQSMTLTFENMGKNHGGVAHRVLYEKQDILEYRELKLFLKSRYPMDFYPIFFIRIGADTNNFYEYRFRLKDNEWTSVSVCLDSLTQFKKSILDTAQNQYAYYRRGNLAFKGRPTLTDIRMYEVGILNDSSDTPLTGEFWVDELRVSGPHRESGIAMNTRVDFKIADIIEGNLTVTREEDNFRSLTSSTPGRETKQSYSASTTFHLESFLPKEWGFSLPLTYSRSKNENQPKYGVGSDVLLTDEQRQAEKSAGFAQSFSFRFSKRGSKNRLLKWFVDPIALQLSGNENESKTPTKMTNSMRRTLTFSYSYSPVVGKPLKILGTEIYYFPSNYSFSLAYNKDSTHVYDLMSGTKTVTPREIGEINGSISYRILRNLNASYSMGRTHNLLWDKSRFFGKEMGRSEELTLNYSFSLFRILSPNLTYRAHYDENRPEDLIMDTLGLRDFNQTTNLDASFSLEIPRFLRFIGSLRNEAMDTVPGGGGPFHPILKLFDKLANFFQAPSFSYTYNRTADYRMATDRPDWKYRLGFTEKIELPSYDNTRSTRSLSNTFNISGRFNLSFASLNYSWNYNITDNKSYGAKYRAVNLTWPNLTLNINSLKGIIPKSDNYLQSASFQATFNRSSQKQKDLAQDLVTQDRWDQSLSPSLRLNFKNGLSANSSFSWNRSEQKNYGFQTSTQENDRKVLSFDVSYSFRNPQGFKLPLFGRKVLRIKSELSTSLRFNIEDSKTIQTGTPTASNRKFSLELNGSYNFSRSVTGGLNFNYVVDKNRLTGRTRKEIGLTANASFKF